jgi:hypothetical protein
MPIRQTTVNPLDYFTIFKAQGGHNHKTIKPSKADIFKKF